MEERPRYIIGIDLGTTNSAVCFIDTDLAKNPTLAIQLLRIPQLTGTGIVEPVPILPSFYYLAGEHEFPYGSLCLPWDPTQLSKKESDKNYAVGLWARDQGARVPTRLIQSAKSWLCNAAANRREKILPPEAAEEERRLSPVEASAAYLRHIKEAWNYSLAKGDITQELEQQEVILTVPASFDEVARTLTIEAAKLAGFSQITLLEEPQAAFYQWIEEHEKKWPSLLKEGEVILVCDVGGGTTDFSLIQVQKQQDTLTFQRMAVGDHLLLGGDNMDIAICHYLESQFKEKMHSELTLNQWLQLKHQARQAKEQLLQDPKSQFSIWLAGEGSKIVQDGQQFSLSYTEIEKILLDGFFGQHSYQEALCLKRGSGLRAMGLPYEADPSITKHLADFLKTSLRNGLPYPSHVLFNGGAMKPLIFQQAIVKSLESWRKHSPQVQENTPVRILPSANLDLAVAKGAAYYGKVKRGLGVRIGGGIARAYYLQIDVKEGNDTVKKALTLLPRGTNEGTSVESTRTFLLTPNKPVSFQLYSSHTRLNDHIGDIIEIKEEELAPLPLLRTLLRYGKNKDYEENIPVLLGIHLTELGTLEIWLKSLKTEHHWTLEFQLRSQSGIENSLTELQQGLSDEVFESRYLAPTKQVIEDTFSLEHRIKADEVMNALENVLERQRQLWPPSILRHLFDVLIKQADKITVSPTYEARFWNLAGFLLRPGMGYPLDDHRIKEIWKLVLADFKSEKNENIELQKWICFRRIGAGFNKGQQLQLFNQLFSLLPFKKGKLEVKKALEYEYQEKLRTLASFELVDQSLKIKLGQIVLQRIIQAEGLPADFWALGRIGARQLLYGTISNTIPRATCEEWIRALMNAKGVDPKELAFLLSQLARKVDQRELNVDPQLIKEVLEMMKYFPQVEQLNETLTQSHMLTLKEQEKLFGDSLPSGLSLET